jgi:hypothetical protein
MPCGYCRGPKKCNACDCADARMYQQLDLKGGAAQWPHARLLQLRLLQRLLKLRLLQLTGCSRRLGRAWKRTLEIRRALVKEGKLAVILVANLGKGGKKLPKGLEPNALVRQKHIHTTVHHAGQGATFLIANEYGWGSESGPGGKPDVQKELGLTLTTRLPTEEPPPTLHGGPSSCWCYAAQEQVSYAETGPRYLSRAGTLHAGARYLAALSPVRLFTRAPARPGTESTQCHNFIATRHSGTFFLEKMPSTFYKNLKSQAYDGRFVCCKARWCKQPAIDWPHAGAAAAAERQPSHFLLATWHGPHKDNVERCQLCLKELCERLRGTCDESADCLGCVLAGDFNLDLKQLELADYVGFRRLDPDENVWRDGCRTEKPHPTRVRKEADAQVWSMEDVAKWAGRRRYGTDNRAPQCNVDHMLFYQPPGSPLMARRPRRFRMYDRQRAGLLPRRRACADAGHCSCSQEATPPDEACAGAVTHEHDGALDHDGLILELWLDGTRQKAVSENTAPEDAKVAEPVPETTETVPTEVVEPAAEAATEAAAEAKSSSKIFDMGTSVLSAIVLAFTPRRSVLPNALHGAPAELTSQSLPPSRAASAQPSSPSLVAFAQSSSSSRSTF